MITKHIVIPIAEHGIAVQQLCPHATEVVRQLQDEGYEAYIVGGSVRDLLLGKVPKDYDVATDAIPEEVKTVFPRARLIGRRFRLAHVRMGGTLIEVATFRGPQVNDDDDHKHKNGRILRDNVWGSLEEDAVRRDFTINALFLDPISGDIQDFVGGYKDLSERKLRLIGDAVTRYREDPVRLLRAARFVAKLGVELEEETGKPVIKLAPLLNDIPPARLFEEVCKLFMTGHAAATWHALQRFQLTRALFPVLKRDGGSGRAESGPLLETAMKNTDDRIAIQKPVTPAFLLAAILWQPVKEKAQALIAGGVHEAAALGQAADEVMSKQVQRTAIPRRFSVITRQLWTMQPRFNNTHGRRAKSLMSERRFRAAYDFLLLRAVEDPALLDLCKHWTEAQKGVVMNTGQNDRHKDSPRRRRRPRRRKPPAAKS
ncbi:MAG: polynucleotide adenylyltransferase PcnB [Xanthomonadales bacterium]|nr:polynucleotide adenylyltransferase PcnB [Xanthomonadales bacterium]